MVVERMEKMSPYIQGELDGCCGMYSVINALRLVDRNLTGLDCARLLKKILLHLEKRKKASSIISDGISGSDIRFVLKEIIVPNYAVTWALPFKKNAPVSLDQYWDEVKTFMNEEPHRAAIVSITCTEWRHWSVIRTITERRVTFFDSWTLSRANRSRLVVGETDNAKFMSFSPQNTFFISHQP